MTIPDEMLSIAEDLLTVAAPRQVEKMQDALMKAYLRGHQDGYECAVMVRNVGGLAPAST